MKNSNVNKYGTGKYTSIHKEVETMAIEAMKAAAMTYQGSASGAAKPIQAKESVKTEKSAPEAGGNSTSIVVEDKIVKPMQPVRSNSEDRGDEAGSNGHQTTRQLQQAVEKLKKTMMTQTEAVFGIHEGTNRVMIKIVDKESKDVIKEYPPEETLDMIQKVWEMAGILVDEKG